MGEAAATGPGLGWRGMVMWGEVSKCIRAAGLRNGPQEHKYKGKGKKELEKEESDRRVLREGVRVQSDSSRFSGDRPGKLCLSL